jgi:cysteine synthase A
LAKIYDGIADLVGHTPLVRFSRLAKAHGVSGEFLGKLEVFNPTGSVKDRIALSMLTAAEREGKIGPGGTVVEGTSGNTGIGLAALAAAKGYKAVIVMPDNMSKERILLLRGLGAEVVLTPAEKNMPGAQAKAIEIAGSRSGAFMPGQGGNPNNPLAHESGTGPEIWDDSDGSVDIFVATVGTGGTITGAGHFLKKKKPGVKIIAVEPSGSALLSGGTAGPHKIQGIGGGVIPPVLDREVYDEVIAVTDEDAYSSAREVAKTEGLLVGLSAGAAVWAALRVAKRPESRGKNIVVLIPDSGERYLSAGIYDEEGSADGH